MIREGLSQHSRPDSYKDMRVVSNTEISQRCFQGWSMAYTEEVMASFHNAHFGQSIDMAESDEILRFMRVVLDPASVHAEQP